MAQENGYAAPKQLGKPSPMESSMARRRILHTCLLDTCMHACIHLRSGRVVTPCVTIRHLNTKGRVLLF